MRYSLAGLVVAVALFATAGTAQASDASLKATVQAQETKFEQAADKYAKAAGHAKTNADLRKARSATKSFSKAVQTYHDKVAAETADTDKYKQGRKQLLDALTTYKDGLDTLVKGIDDKSTPKIKSALKKVVAAAKKYISAAKVFGLT